MAIKALYQNNMRPTIEFVLSISKNMFHYFDKIEIIYTLQ